MTKSVHWSAVNQIVEPESPVSGSDTSNKMSESQPAEATVLVNGTSDSQPADGAADLVFNGVSDQPDSSILPIKPPRRNSKKSPLPSPSASTEDLQKISDEPAADSSVKVETPVSIPESEPEVAATPVEKPAEPEAPDVVLKFVGGKLVEPEDKPDVKSAEAVISPAAAADTPANNNTDKLSETTPSPIPGRAKSQVESAPALLVPSQNTRASTPGLDHSEIIPQYVAVDPAEGAPAPEPEAPAEEAGVDLEKLRPEINMMRQISKDLDNEKGEAAAEGTHSKLSRTALYIGAAALAAGVVIYLMRQRK